MFFYMRDLGDDSSFLYFSVSDVTFYRMTYKSCTILDFFSRIIVGMDECFGTLLHKIVQPLLKIDSR